MIIITGWNKIAYFYGIYIIFYSNINYQKFNSSKQNKCGILQFFKPQFQHSFHWAKIKIQAGLHPFWQLQRRTFSCHFQLLQAIHIFRLIAHIPSLKTTIYYLSDLPSSHLFLTTAGKGFPLSRTHVTRLSLPKHWRLFENKVKSVSY